MAGHNLNDERERTDDVEFDYNLEFSKMFLSDTLVRGLSRNNFLYPSPIQARAIPLGRLGLDLLVQAKSGTGKTLVFTVLMLEGHNPDICFPQSLVIVPTREIAVQIEQILNQVGYSMPNFRAQSFIGGMDVAQDRKNLQGCSAVVGTPGRIVHLIKSGLLNTSKVNFLILDEADSLISGSMQSDVDHIIRTLPAKRQTVVCSATFYNNRDRQLLKYLNDSYIGVTPKKEAPVLQGIRQFIREIPETKDNIKEMMAKIAEMDAIFKKMPFSQCLVFANTQTKVETYCSYLNRAGWSTEVIRGGQDQRLRLKTVKNLKKFKIRILAATDVIARGIDAENVNLVINIDVPRDNSVYLHRIGRAGRFGTKAIAITLASGGKDIDRFRNILFDIGGNEMFIYRLPEAEIEKVWNFDQYGNKYDKFYASKLEQQISDAGTDRLEPILEVDSKTELDSKSAETLDSSSMQSQKKSDTSMEEDSLEKIARLRKEQSETPMEADSLEKMADQKQNLDSDEEEALEEIIQIIPLGDMDPVPEVKTDFNGNQKVGDCEPDLKIHGELDKTIDNGLEGAEKHPLQFVDDEIQKIYFPEDGKSAKEQQISTSMSRCNDESTQDRSKIDQMFLDAMKKVELDDSTNGGESTMASVSLVDKMFLAAMEAIDKEESQSHIDRKAAEPFRNSVDGTSVAVKISVESETDEFEPELDTVDKMFLAAMNKLNFEEEVKPTTNGISPEAMDKFDIDEEYNVPQAVRPNSSPELSCSTPESCYTSDSSFSSNATKKVEVGSNFTTPNSRVLEIRGAAPTRQISSSTSDNSELSQMSDAGVPTEPNCLPLEVNNDALFAKIMEQKELEAEHQQQRPFQFSIDGCSLEVHDDPVSDRDINSRKGSVPDVVPSGITMDPSRLQNRSPPPGLEQEGATFDLNSNTCGSNHGSVFEPEEEVVVCQDQRPKRIRFQQDGSSDSLELKSDSGNQPGDLAGDQDPLALPPIQDATNAGTEDASSYSSEYDSQSSNSSFFDQRDLWESEAAEQEVPDEQQQRRLGTKPKVSKRAKDATNAYHRTYASWTNQYWNQMTMIRDYARFAQYARHGTYSGY